MRVDLVEERNADGASPSGRQHQKRNPDDHRNHDDAPARELERIAGQMRTPQRLKQRPADDN